MKSEIDKNYFGLDLYEKVVSNRLFSADQLDKEKDTSYKTKILNLLPNYEKELLKYSNNSYERNIKIKNKYKKLKKQCFSWRGYWSDAKIFFGENSSSNFALKLVNHYTRNFMKPILVPILDIEHYLPAFSNFDKNKLFKSSEKNNFFLNLDLDKILKSSEQSQLILKDKTDSIQEMDNNNDNDINNENYLQKIYMKSNQDLAEKLLKISNRLDFGKAEEFIFLRKNNNVQKKSKKNYFLCCIVKTSHHIKGVCFIDENQLNFKVFHDQKTGRAMKGVKISFTDKDDDYDKERKTCFGSYFVCHPKDKYLFKKSINYKDIKLILRRRYYYKNTGLEIFTVTNKSFYLNFKYEQDRETAILLIENKVQNLVKIIDDLKDSKYILGYGNAEMIIRKDKKKRKKNKKKKIKLSKLIKQWKKWKISNFEFLMWLNIFGNRSYNDISQYPVFPWILSNYSDPLKIEQKTEEENEENNNIDYSYRDLSSPMGMLELGRESIKRKEEFLEIYDTLKNDNECPEEENEEINMKIKPYIFGSNYSNPIYVCNFLMRIFPFTHISIELQGDLDKAERLFLSVENSFHNSTTQKTDVRELIPEFFYLPEMFININNLNLGHLENGQEVNDVVTPCNNNPYDFIMIMRSVLENDELSYKINSWIDLIFGSKAKGKESENANNIFTEESYQEDINLKGKKDKESLLRRVEFGLIPSQIMNKDCSKKEKKRDILKEKEITDANGNLKIEKTEKKKSSSFSNIEGEKIKLEKIDNNKDINNLSVLKAYCSFEDKIYLLYNFDYLLEKKISKSSDKKTYINETTNTIKFEKTGNRIYNYQYPKEYNDKVYLFLDDGKTIIIGGYYDGKIVFIYTEPEIKIKEIIPFKEEIPICAITLSEDEDYLFVGNKKGNIKMFKRNNENKYDWISVKEINDQMSEISHIFCNNELNLWSSVTTEGYINLYSFPLSKLLRCIKIPTNNCKYIFLSSSPLPSIIAICNDKNENEIFAYSINGKLLYRQKEQDNITCPNIIKDLNSNDYLVYICKNNIYIRSIHNLIIQVLIDETPGIYAIFTNLDKTILYAINKDGSEIYLIKDDPKS